MTADPLQSIDVEELLARNRGSNLDEPRHEPTPAAQEQKRQKPATSFPEMGTQ
jgi:hypothetical protein